MLKSLMTALAFGALAAPAALACSCAPCQPFETKFETEPNINAFIGELVSVRRSAADLHITGEASSSHASELIHLFHVKRALNADMPKYVMVRTRSNPVACGTSFSFNGLNAVAVSQNDQGQYSSSACLQLCWMSDQNRALVTEDTVQTRRAN